MIAAPWIPNAPDPPYVVGDLEVCVVAEPSKVVRAPTAEERVILDELYTNPEMFNPETSQPYRLYGVEIPGIDGLVLTYPAKKVSG